MTTYPMIRVRTALIGAALYALCVIGLFVAVSLSMADTVARCKPDRKSVV